MTESTAKKRKVADTPEPEEFEPPEGRVSKAARAARTEPEPTPETSPTPVEPGGEEPTSNTESTDTTPTPVGERKKFDFGKRRYPGGVYLYASQLKAGEHNTRIWSDPVNIAAIREMADGILAGEKAGTGGIRTPIKIVDRDYYEGDQIEIDDGQIRVRAVLLLEGREFAPGVPVEAKRVDPDTIAIPAIRAEKNRNDKARTVDFVVVNIHSHRPQPLELARSFLRMQQVYKMTQLEIAEAIGKPSQQSWVSQMLSLNRVPDEVQEHIVNHRISSTTAINMLRDHGEEGVSEAVRKAIEARGDEPEGGEEDESPASSVVQLDDHRPRNRSKGSGSGRSRSSSGRSGRRSGNRITARETAAAAGDHIKAAYTEGNFKTVLQAIYDELEGEWASEKTKEHLTNTLKGLGLPLTKEQAAA